MKKILIFILFILISTISYGRIKAEDIQPVLLIESDKTAITNSDELTLKFTIQNTTKEPLSFLKGDSEPIVDYLDQLRKPLEGQQKYLPDWFPSLEDEDFIELNPNEKIVLSSETLNLHEGELIVYGKQYNGLYLETKFFNLKLKRNRRIFVQCEYRVYDTEINYAKDKLGISNLYVKPIKSNLIEIKIKD